MSELIANDAAADFLSEVANSSAAEATELLRDALASEDAEAGEAVAAAVVVAAVLGYSAADADIDEIIAAGTITLSDEMKANAADVLDAAGAPEIAVVIRRAS